MGDGGALPSVLILVCLRDTIGLAARVSVHLRDIRTLGQTTTLRTLRPSLCQQCEETERETHITNLPSFHSWILNYEGRYWRD